MDIELVDRKGVPIPEWVAQEGWSSFRNAEAQLFAELSKREPLIVSTGGGIISKETSIALLKKNFKAFYLHWAPEILAMRIKNDKNRPALKQNQSTLEEVQSLYTERDPIYRKCAKVIKCEKRDNIATTLQKIIDQL